MLNHLFRHNMSQKALHMSSGSEKCSEVELSIHVYSSTRLQEECDIDSSSSNEASAVTGIQGKRHTQEMTEDGADSIWELPPNSYVVSDADFEHQYE